MCVWNNNDELVGVPLPQFHQQSANSSMSPHLLIQEAMRLCTEQGTETQAQDTRGHSHTQGAQTGNLGERVRDKDR